jgi:hypothetical protein
MNSVRRSSFPIPREMCPLPVKRYVSRIVRLAFLAPDIVEQIVKGCQPPELTAESLLKDRTQLLLDWEAQHRALGFSPAN